jgi:hypothetical protein
VIQVGIEQASVHQMPLFVHQPVSYVTVEAKQEDRECLNAQLST